jgi:hypothetical protein
MRPLKGSESKRGYWCVTLKSFQGNYITKDIHPLVCVAFHGVKPGPEYVAAHKDGDKSNNRPDNLSWKTQADNLKDKFAHGTHDRGRQNSRAKLTQDQCLELKRLLEETDMTRAEIGAQFGLTADYVNRIVQGKRYPGLNIVPRWSHTNRRKRGSYSKG